MPKPGRTGIERVVAATGYSWRGLRAAYKHEAAFRQELILCAVLAPLGLWLGRTGIERALLLGSLFLILIVEVLNSAIESVVDRVSDEHHELSGRAKDMGSAAVFVSLVCMVVIWWLVLAR